MFQRDLLFFLGDGGEDGELTDLQFTVYLSVAIGLVLMAGLMSGLTLGLMSLDTVELEVLKRSGTAQEKKYAAIIAPVVANQHLLLVTLLLCNAAATEALPLFIDRLADPFTAVLVSVTVVLVFGEILPQAICSRYGLMVGAYASWFVRLLMMLCSPVAWPIAKLLDYLLGADHSALFRRAQLKALVDVHSSDAGFGGTLGEQEIAVIRGALDLTSKTAAKSMTPLDKVFMLSTADRLDERTMQAILLSGHSRIPIYSEGNRKDIQGLILSKELVLINPADNVLVSDLKMRELPKLPACTPMYDMLKLFETGKSHMALITGSAAALSSSIDDLNKASKASKHKAHGMQHDQTIKRLGSAGTATFQTASYRGLYGGDDVLDGQQRGEEDEEELVVGIITIEDVIEELLQEEIIDETDLFVDNLQATRVNAAEVAGALPPRLQRLLNTGLFTPRVGRLAASQKFSMPPPLYDGDASRQSTQGGQPPRQQTSGAGERTLQSAAVAVALSHVPRPSAGSHGGTPEHVGSPGTASGLLSGGGNAAVPDKKDRSGGPRGGAASGAGPKLSLGLGLLGLGRPGARELDREATQPLLQAAPSMPVDESLV